MRDGWMDGWRRLFVDFWGMCRLDWVVDPSNAPSFTLCGLEFQDPNLVILVWRDGETSWFFLGKVESVGTFSSVDAV